MRSTRAIRILTLAFCAGCSAASSDPADDGSEDLAGGTGGEVQGAGGSSGSDTSGGASPITTGGTNSAGGTANPGAGGRAGSNQGGSNAGGGNSGVDGGSVGKAGSSGTGAKSDGGVACTGAAANPLGLVTGVWTSITPPDPHNPGEEDHDFVNDVQIDPSHPSTVYVLTRGVEKSTDGGRTWTNISTFALPQRIRIDPNNPDHLLTIQGVHATGFFATTNGGKSWETPAGFTAISAAIGGDSDMYGIEVDPTDFGHFLLTFHWYWDNCTSGCTSGVVECFNGGASCVAHKAIPGVTGNGGHNAFFLYNPSLGLGDAKTWIFMTQPGGSGEGWWRTTDAGASWTNVSTVPMIHGGSQIYYATDGTLYAAAWNTLRKSTDNGATWSNSWPQPLFGVQGNGKNLFVISANGGKFQTSPETGNAAWTNYGDHTFGHGASEITYDRCNHIMYGAMREDGAWAVKLE